MATKMKKLGEELGARWGSSTKELVHKITPSVVLLIAPSPQIFRLSLPPPYAERPASLLWQHRAGLHSRPCRSLHCFIIKERLFKNRLRQIDRLHTSCVKISFLHILLSWTSTHDEGRSSSNQPPLDTIIPVLIDSFNYFFYRQLLLSSLDIITSFLRLFCKKAQWRRQLMAMLIAVRL